MKYPLNHVRYILVFSLFYLNLNVLSAQHLPFSSQSINHWGIDSNPSALNLIEMRKSLDGTFINVLTRIQSIGTDLPNSPITYALNVTSFTNQTPNPNITSEEKKSESNFFGGYLFYDKAGAFQTLNLNGKYAHYLGNDWRVGISFGLNYSDLNVRSQKESILIDPLLNDTKRMVLNGGFGFFQNKEKYLLGFGVQTFGLSHFWDELRVSNQFGWRFSDQFDWYNNILYKPKLKSLIITSTLSFYIQENFSISSTIQKDTFYDFQTLGFYFGLFNLDGHNRLWSTLKKNIHLDIMVGANFPINAVVVNNPSMDLKVTFNLSRISLPTL